VCDIDRCPCEGRDAADITWTPRLVDTVTPPLLLKVVDSGRLQPSRLVTHRFALDDG
jgi:alcohol dehydrogenase